MREKVTEAGAKAPAFFVGRVHNGPCLRPTGRAELSETDLRPHDPEHGWLHALAHGADAALFFALHPALTRDDALELLGVLTERLASVTELPAQWEDDRLALALFAVLTRPPLTEADRSVWVQALAPRLTPTFGQPRPVAMALTVQVARSLLLFTLLGAQLPGGQVIPAPAREGWPAELLQVLRAGVSGLPGVTPARRRVPSRTL